MNLAAIFVISGLLADLALAASDDPDVLLEQAFAHAHRLTTYECEFSLVSTNSPPGKAREKTQYRGLHRFASPNRFYVEYSQIVENGRTHDMGRVIQSSEGGNTSFLTTYEDGKSEGVITPGENLATPISVGIFLIPPYLRKLEEILKPDSKRVERQGNEVLIHCTSPNKKKETTLRLSLMREGTIIGIDFAETIETLGTFRTNIKYDIQRVGDVWQCVGGTHRQDLPDGSERVNNICTILPASIRINPTIPPERLRVPIPSGISGYDDVNHRPFPTVTAASVKPETVTELSRPQSLPAGQEPAPRTFVATSTHWSRWGMAYGMTALLAVALLIFAYLYRTDS